MGFTIEQMLQQAITAYTHGNLQDAERIYCDILGSHPKQPDANHNLAIILLFKGREAEALLLFKTALEADPSRQQHRMSYIDALIGDSQPENAYEVIIEGKNLGLVGDKIDLLEAQLSKVILSQSFKLVNDNKILTFKEKRKKLSDMKRKKKKQKQTETTTTDVGSGPTDLQTKNLVGYYSCGRYGDAEKLALS